MASESVIVVLKHRDTYAVLVEDQTISAWKSVRACRAYNKPSVTRQNALNVIALEATLSSARAVQVVEEDTTFWAAIGNEIQTISNHNWCIYQDCVAFTDAEVGKSFWESGVDIYT